VPDPEEHLLLLWQSGGAALWYFSLICQKAAVGLTPNPQCPPTKNETRAQAPFSEFSPSFRPLACFKRLPCMEYRCHPMVLDRPNGLFLDSDQSVISYGVCEGRRLGKFSVPSDGTPGAQTLFQSGKFFSWCQLA